MSSYWPEGGRGVDYDRFLHQENASHASARIRREVEAEWLENNIKEANRGANSARRGRIRSALTRLCERFSQSLKSL